MKNLSRFGADILFILHFFVVIIGLFGWMVESIWYLYMILLITTLISGIFLGYCFLSKWEFFLRKMRNPKLSYNYNWTSFYTHKFTNNKLSNTFIEGIALFFIVISIFINIYFHFFY